MIKISDLVKKSTKIIFSNISSPQIKISKVSIEFKNGDFRSFLLKKAFDAMGEWWIDDSGNAQFADGDIGDMNHEAMAAEMITCDVLSYFDISCDAELGPISDSDYLEEIWDFLIENEKAKEEEYEEFEEDPLVFIERTIDPENTKLLTALNIAWNWESYDARDYAMEYYGWKRMAGRVIQTQTLTSNDLDIIVAGFEDAYPEYIEKNPKAEFTIEVNATRNLYNDVPFYVLELRSPTALNEYRMRY